jgi:hypothetical protein
MHLVFGQIFYRDRTKRPDPDVQCHFRTTDLADKAFLK